MIRGRDLGRLIIRMVQGGTVLSLLPIVISLIDIVYVTKGTRLNKGYEEQRPAPGGHGSEVSL